MIENDILMLNYDNPNMIMANIINKLSISLALLSLVGCATGDIVASNYYSQCSSSNDERCKEQMMIAACTATANSYPYSRDRLLFDEYAALFTEDAEFQIEGGPQSLGREAIVHALKTRGPLMQTRHLSKVVDMRVTGTTEVQGLSYVTVWRKRHQGDEQSLEGQAWIVGEYHDQFVMEGDNCLIHKRLVKIVFQQP